MTANAGTTPQSATAGAAFATALAVTVLDSLNNPVSRASVTFTAPGSGASGIFTNSTATITVATNASGIATAPFTANSTPGGPYNVTASASGLTSVGFSLTNTAGASPFTVTSTAAVVDRLTGRFRRTITVVNSGPALTASAFVTDALPAGVAMHLPNGTTSATSPTGSPYREMGAFGSGATITLTLEFTRTATQAITYTPRILGAGAR